MAELAPTIREDAPRLIVEVRTSSLAGRRFSFTSKDLRRGVLLGRGPNCLVRFDANRDLRVSSRHALLVETDFGVFVRDEGSSNGVYLNQRRVTGNGERVFDGAEIRLGQEGALLRLRVPGELPPDSAGVEPARQAAPVPEPARQAAPVPEPARQERSTRKQPETRLKVLATKVEVAARERKKRSRAAMMVALLLLLSVAIAVVIFSFVNR